MRKQGTVVRFDADRGFGFIRSPQTSADIFFHVKEFRSQGAVSPGIGMQVSFDEIHVGGKGPRAIAVRLGIEDQTRSAPAIQPRRRPQASRRGAAQAASTGAWFILPLMLVYLAAVAWGVWMHKLPWWVLAALPALNVATFFAYWQDKYAAQQDQWRIAENTLHLWSFAGGWAGAWFAQRLLLHKTRKESFREAYWFTVVLHCALLGAWLWWSGSWPEGA